MAADNLKFIRHELKTSLNHIIGYSEILIDDSLDLDISFLEEPLKEVVESSEMFS